MRFYPFEQLFASVAPPGLPEGRESHFNIACFQGDLSPTRLLALKRLNLTCSHVPPKLWTTWSVLPLPVPGRHFLVFIFLFFSFIYFEMESYGVILPGLNLII